MKRITPTFLILTLASLVGCVASTPVVDEPVRSETISLAVTPIRADTQVEQACPFEPAALPLPFGARQMEEGYWLSAMIGPNDIPALKQMGIRVVLSAVEPDPKTTFLMSTSAITQISIPMGSTFRHADAILDVLEEYEPEQIFIHCTHGADRTGVIAAYILVMRHKWRIEDALYAVLYATEEDIAGLQTVLQEFCIVAPRSPDDATVGFYSLTRAGMQGGLKVRSRRYRRLVRTTLEQMITPVTNDLCR